MNLKVGTVIKIIHMVGEPKYSNKVGIIMHIDSMNQLHGTWGGCAITEDDTIEVVSTTDPDYFLAIAKCNKISSNNTKNIIK